ncbi:MAG TPA: hypothetical protein VF576_13305 [Rubricoccaceae bacterium]|jgi:hypothetical protein
MATTIPGGLTLTPDGKPQDANGERLPKSELPEAGALSATIQDLDKRATAIEAKQPIQRFAFTDLLAMTDSVREREAAPSSKPTKGPSKAKAAPAVPAPSEGATDGDDGPPE